MARNRLARARLAPDPVVEAYKRDLDLTLLRSTAKLGPEERIRELMRLEAAAEALARAGRRAFHDAL